jgi:DMSO reductase family type II enzyme heme b subunit
VKSITKQIRGIQSLTILIMVFVFALMFAGHLHAAVVPVDPKPAETPELVEQGKGIYLQRCSFCHGLLGDGNGPAADYLDPRPRDFTLGTFKFRTTQSGELPLDEDIFRTVSRGLPGTGMQSFDSDLIKNGLSEQERWAVIFYVKTFAMEFADPEYDPVANDMVVSLPQNRAPYNDETIAKGKEVFEKAKCWECHGKQGRGNGQKSFDRTDDWGFPIRIRNVTHPWKIKAGIEVEDIYMRFSTGINGTPMPSFVKALSEEERWYLANFIKSLQHQLTDNQVLKVQAIIGDVPDDPDNASWATATPMDIRLTGQVIAAPRWQNPSIELATIRALHNDEDIVFLLEWDDPFEDATHNKEKEFDASEIGKVGAYNSYIPANEVLPRQLETFTDSVALQFPTKPTTGTKKPHFFRGDASNPVQLWIWKAVQEKQGEQPVEEAVARGWKQNPKAQAQEQQQVSATGSWAEGRWRVIMKRPLITDDRNDVQFVKGQFIPMALNAWDGSNGEHGLVMSLSSWYSVIIEAPIPNSVYIYTLLAILITAALGIWFTRKAQAETTTDL